MSAHAAGRPQPLLTRAHIVAAIGGLITALVMFGILPAALGDQLSHAVEVINGSIATVVAVVAPIVHALVSRSSVTPSSDPQTNDGVKLVRAVADDPTLPNVLAVLDAASVLAETDTIHPVDSDPSIPPDEASAGAPAS